jgi:polyphenol oxidase
MRGHGRNSGGAGEFSRSRRDLFALLGKATVAGAALNAMPFGPARAQDNPNDCSPIGVAGKTPVKFQPNDGPVRTRKSAFELSNTEVDRLKAAYAALRKLTKDTPDDPRGWLSQGHVHCWYCGGGDNGQQGEEIHGSWRFFPWHRAYLYFHERILCKLINDDTLALPYWDWDSRGRQTFPAVYGDPGDPSNPLSDMLRSAKPGDAIDRGAVSTAILNRTINSSTANLFMGTQNGTAGAMENAPHGPVHIWTGDTTMQAVNNDMGVLATAAQDPVFFAHHGNIDRLWTVWLGLAPSHRNFTSPTWLTHTWEFYDENSVWTRIAISDVLDTVKSLRFQYQPPSVAPIWTFRQRAPAMAAALNVAPPPAVIVANAPDGIPLGSGPLTQSVSLPPESASAFSALGTDSPDQYVLHIEGITVPANRQAMFNVFVNLPGANATTQTDVPNYVGTVTVLAKRKEAAGHQHESVNAAFDVTDVLGSVAKTAGPNLSVTLVPAAGSTATGATYKRIYIDQM